MLRSWSQKDEALMPLVYDELPWSLREIQNPPES
jgi:hypothetical protein